jgi:hypothetical protein
MQLATERKNTMAFPKRSPILEAIDADSYDYLETAFPDLLLAIETEVRAGKTPEKVMKLVLQAVGPDRLALAYRCQQAAHHIAKMQG